MIKLKQLLLENTAPDIFVPRRIEDRIERMIKTYIRNGSNGDLKLTGLDLTKLPDILKDITVGGNFNCSYNELTSLEGAPKTVGENFGCSYNKLTSLDGAPKIVYNDFYCRNNNVQFTEAQVRAVCDVKGDVFVWLN